LLKQQADTGIKKLWPIVIAVVARIRNYKTALFWSYIVMAITITEINHKFMILGNSYLTNDRDFGVIEKKKHPAMHIYMPDDWMRLFSLALK